MTGYESGKFKSGDQLPTGETFIGETEDGSPLWSEPVPSPAPKPGSTVEDALGMLTELVNSLYNRQPIENDYRDSLATVRDALERLREERDRLASSGGAYMERALAAEAEVRRLNGYIDQYILDVERLTEERDRLDVQCADDYRARRAAEAEVRRLTEGLRAISAEASRSIRAENRLPFLTHIGVIAETTLAGDPERHARALLSANPPQGDAAEGSSPSDGGGAK